MIGGSLGPYLLNKAVLQMIIGDVIIFRGAVKGTLACLIVLPNNEIQGSVLNIERADL